VDRIAEGILEAAPHCRPGTLITDVGSTKGNIIAVVAGKLPAGVEYVPAHPLAGSEKSGAENARADLFAGRVTLVVPVPGNSRGAIERVTQFWQGLGARVIEVDPAEHDRALAVTSHLPHAVASGVAGVTPKDWLNLTAGGFRDVTRIAAGDPHLWAAIFTANRDAVLAAVARFTDRLSRFRAGPGAGPGLADWLAEGKQVRDALGS
jgi:prephenate dehydrogenase